MTFRLCRYAVTLLLAAWFALGVASGPSAAGPSPQRAGRGAGDDEQDVILPNGKSQKDAILKAEYEQNMKDSAQLTELAQQLQQEIEKNGPSVFSMSTVKKTDDIEKLVRKIRTRIRHY